MTRCYTSWGTGRDDGFLGLYSLASVSNIIGRDPVVARVNGQYQHPMHIAAYCIIASEIESNSYTKLSSSHLHATVYRPEVCVQIISLKPIVRVYCTHGSC